MAPRDSGKPERDRHPELSAPIVDLSLESLIARAERRVIDRDARVRQDAARVESILRTRSARAAKGAAIVAAAGMASLAAYEGFKALRRRRRLPAEEPGAGRGGSGRWAAEMAALAKVASDWALSLHREQGLAGALLGVIRWASRRRSREGTIDPGGSTVGEAPGAAGRFERGGHGRA